MTQTSDIAPTVLAYMAGVLDSDGYIGVHKSDYAMRVRGDAGQVIYSPRVQLKQVDTEAVDLFHETFGGYRTVNAPSRNATNGKPLNVWSVHSAACAPVLRAVLPHLRIKADRARNALAVCDINTEGRRRTFDIPEVVDGEPMVTMAEAARRTGKSYDVVLQSVRKGNVPHVRTGPRKVLIPESYLPIWAERGNQPRRRQDVTERLEACFQRAKELNRVGV